MKLHFFKIFLFFSIITTASSCKLWDKVFNKEPKRGCPTDGRNVGAEKVLSLKGKEAKKAKKAKMRGGTE
jgi:hypothetical protein